MKEFAPKYVIHESGLPIRLPPYLRKGLEQNNSLASMQLDMIQTDPCIGKRSQADTLPENLPENVRLRKIARAVSQDLVVIAENMEAKRYCTIVHGSVSKGLVRNQLSGDKSDIDIDLVLSEELLNKDQKKSIREGFRQKSDQYGSRIDTYVFTIDDLKRNVGCNARRYLRSSAYSIANKNNLWEEVLWTGLEAQYFTNLEPIVRKKIRRIIVQLFEGKIKKISDYASLSRRRKQVLDYFGDRGILPDTENNDTELINSLFTILAVK